MLVLIIVLSFLLLGMLIPPAIADEGHDKDKKDKKDDKGGKGGKGGKGSNNQFTNKCNLNYTAGSSNSFDGIPEGHIYWAANLTKDAGTIDVYDDAGGLHVKVTLYLEVKPFVAFGEKDRDGDGVVEEDEIRSDGITFTIDNTSYEWYYHSGPYNSHVTVPRGDEVRTMSPIVYRADIPPSNVTSPVSICVNLHASPNYKPYTPPTPIPEFPTMALPVLAVMGLLFLLKRHIR